MDQLCDRRRVSHAMRQGVARVNGAPLPPKGRTAAYARMRTPRNWANWRICASAALGSGAKPKVIAS